MADLYTLYHLILADFQERSQRYSFLVIIFANLFLAYQVYIGNFTPRLGYHQGANNTAWVGASITCTCTLMLVIFGFYLVKNSITRDYETGVGQILAATHLGRISYVFAKVLSNFAVLATIIVAIGIAALLMVVSFGWVGTFDLWQLFAPFLLVALPPMFLVAALAVLFESIRFLRGGWGNAIYFIAILCALPIGMEMGHPAFDFMGIELFTNSMEAAVLLQYPGADVPFNLHPEHIPDLKIFVWDGIDWSVAIVLPKLALIGAGILVTFLASLFFDRFDLYSNVRTGKAPHNGIRPVAAAGRNGSQIEFDSDLMSRSGSDYSLSPLIWEELKLMLKGQHKIWYLLVLGLLIAQLAAPLSAVRGYILPITWALPTLIWSAMGIRDSMYGTRPVMFSMPYAESRHLASGWMAGIIVALVTASGALLHALLAWDFQYTVALITGAVFVPTVAMSLGLLSKTSRLFEAVYATIWYVGPLNHMPQLDFAGAVPAGYELGIPFWFLGISVCLIALMFFVRRYHVRFT